jgi:hypothetical protein
VSTATESTATAVATASSQQELQLLQDTTVKTATTAKLKNTFILIYKG